MRNFVLVLLPLLALFLQTNFFRAYPLQGTIPDLILILVVFQALFNGAYKGTIYGVLCGLLEDLYIGRFIGINAISKGITAYVAGRLQGNVFRENVLVGVIGVTGGTLLNASLLFILSLASHDVFNLDRSILISIVYQVIYNTVIAIPMYVWYYHSANQGVLRETGDR
jgi:rod shape-determining protein MreD